MQFYIKDEHLKELFSKAFSSFFLRVLAAFLLFAINIIVSRSLGAEASGYYFLTISVLLVLSTVFRLGTDQAITRLSSTYSSGGFRSEISGLYSYVFKVLALVLFFVSLLLFVFSEEVSNFVFRKSELSFVLSMLSPCVFFLGLLVSQGYFFQGLKLTSMFQFCQNLGQPLFLFVFLAPVLIFDIRLTVSIVSVLHLLSCVFPFAIAFFIWRRRFSSPGLSDFDSSDLWRSALPLWGGSSLVMLMNWGATILLGSLDSSESVAIFYNAFRTSSLVILVLLSINSIAAPKFSELYYKNDIASIRRLSIISTRVMILFTSPIFLCFFFFPEFVMGFFGEEFKAGANVLIILSLGQVSNVATGSVLLLLSMTGHERYVLISSALATTAMLLLCLTLIPLFGVEGAAVAYSIALSAQMILCTYYVYKTLGFMPVNIFSRC